MKIKYKKVCQACGKGEMKYTELFIASKGYKHLCEHCKQDQYFVYIYPRIVDADLDPKPTTYLLSKYPH